MMKNIIKLVMLCMTLMMLVSGCGTIDASNDEGNTSNADNSGNTANQIDSGDVGTDETTVYSFEAEVMEAGDYLLVTPEEESNEFRSSDKISVGSNDAVITNNEGEKITVQELKPGDILKITYNGIILESYPAQIGASAIEVIGHNILIDGYLSIIDDIWQEDSGLNSEIEMITLDTTGWIELSDTQKEIILANMKKTYGVEIVVGTFDELAEQGIIDKENLYFENGVHIAITNMQYDEKDEKITYSISKWRSGLGAVGSDGATAEYKDSNWIITKGSMWIS